jgi:hypothetical protein
MLVSPDRLYLWRNSAPNDAPPTYSFDAGPLLEHYFKRANVDPTDPTRVEHMAFEMLVEWWLNDLTRLRERDAPSELARSGLLEKIQGAEVVRESI